MIDLDFFALGWNIFKLSIGMTSDELPRYADLDLKHDDFKKELPGRTF